MEAERAPGVAQTRARVLLAARRQMAAGDTSLPMNALARLAGVGVGTVYRHFPDRQSLLEAVAADGLRALVAVAAEAAADPDPAAGLRRLLAAGLDQQLRDPGLAAVLSAPADWSPETAAVVAGLGGSMASLLARARAAGAVRADITADDLRRLICGVRTAVGAGDRAAGDLERYLSVLLAGLRPELPLRS